MKWKPIIIALVYFAGFWSGYYNAVEQYESRPKITLGPAVIESKPVHDTTLDREKVVCEFDKPLKHVILINHWYDDWEALNRDYLLFVEPEFVEEVWGWSKCIWQPDDNWAACDIYAVVPEFIHADMAMDTLGHELLHGACGEFHE